MNLSRSFATIVFAICFNVAFAQKENIFLGTLLVDGGASYSYRLQFTDSAGAIKGYSITDVNGPNHTKTAIRGSISPSNKEIRFKETGLLMTKSKIGKDSFCYVSARLKLANLKGTKILRGKFTGHLKDGTECAKGNIILADKNDVLDKLMQIGPQGDSIAELIKREDNSIEKNDLPIAQTEKNFSLSPGTQKELVVNGREIKIELWDNGKIDGDIVTISMNNEIILDHYLLNSEIKRLNIQLLGTTNTITITANNEGSEPPNTARMKLVDGNNEWLIDASSSINKPSFIILKSK